MRWLSANWIGIVVIGGMLWMHFGMNRGHGGHGGHGQSPEPEQQPEQQGTSAGHETHHPDDPATRTTGEAPGGS